VELVDFSFMGCGIVALIRSLLIAANNCALKKISLAIPAVEKINGLWSQSDDLGIHHSKWLPPLHRSCTALS
jgi:hypothetical protein